MRSKLRLKIIENYILLHNILYQTQNIFLNENGLVPELYNSIRNHSLELKGIYENLVEKYRLNDYSFQLLKQELKIAMTKSNYRYDCSAELLNKIAKKLSQIKIDYLSISKKLKIKSNNLS